MWYETEIHGAIDWQGVTVDGFRPNKQILEEMFQKAGLQPKYRGLKGDKAYCEYGLQIKKEFHDAAREKSLACDDKCLTRFLIPGNEFSLDFEDIHDELKTDKHNYPSTYRILMFQFPKGSCDVYKKCIENLLKKTGFKNKESYRNLFGCKIDLGSITRGEVKDSPLYVLGLHIKNPPLEKFPDAIYRNAWPVYSDFSYSHFEKWYLDLVKERCNML